MNPKAILLPVLFAALSAADAHGQLLSQPALDSTREYYSIAAALKEPDKVYRLRLTKKKLREVPPEISQFKNLNALDLGRNRLKELPEWLSELTFMQEFRAPQNKFRAMPAVVCSWPHLKRLDLHQTEIASRRLRSDGHGVKVSGVIRSVVCRRPGAATGCRQRMVRREPLLGL